MNARQKAKKYKKKCEQLEKMMLPLKRSPIEIFNYPVVDLMAEQLVDMSDLTRMSAREETEFTMINKVLAGQLIHNILNYAEIEQFPNPYGYDYDKVLIRARMKVVDLRLCNKGE